MLSRAHTQIGFAYVSDFSGVSMFNSLCVAAYNALLFVPVVFFFLDKDLSEEFVMSTPVAYSTTRLGVLMNRQTLLVWFGRAVVQVRARTRGARCGGLAVTVSCVGMR